jgi:ABC-type cobalamin/Fe3+-siderophores transport system ATPase subunit
MIAAQEITLKAGSRTLFEAATFTVERGEFVAVLGPNGVGKTTLLRALAGVRPPEKGRVLIGKDEVGALPAAVRARSIAHIAGDDLFIDRLTVRDVVAMGRYAHHQWWQWSADAADERAIAAALGAVHMHEFAERRFDTLSSGERQRIWLALALAQEAQVLLLDEPTSHLDVRVAQDILQLLRAQTRAGKSVVCVLHDVNEAIEFSDRVLLLGCGRVLAYDSPQNIAQSGLLEDAYGIVMDSVRLPSGALRVFPRGATTETAAVESRVPGYPKN